MLVICNLIFLNDQNQEELQGNWNKEARNQEELKNKEKAWSAKFRSLKRAHAKMALGCEIISQPLSIAANITLPLRKSSPAAKSFRSLLSPSTKIFAAAKWPFGTWVPFRSPVHPFRRCEMVAKRPHLEILHFGAETPFRSCETDYYSKSTIS